MGVAEVIQRTGESLLNVRNETVWVISHRHDNPMLDRHNNQCYVL